MNKDKLRQLEEAMTYMLSHRLPNAPYERTNQLIAESKNNKVLDADMDVSDAILVLSRFRLDK